MIRRTFAALLLVMLLGACSNEDGGPGNSRDDSVPIVLGSPTVPGAPEFGVGTILIDGAEQGEILLRGEVADTEETRSFGLMGRTELPDDYGMVFFLFEEKECCFYMKNTPLPLSIAFFDKEGTIVDMKDMEPCEAEPCELYSSAVPYVAALEVKQGMFEEWGVSVGDRIRVVQ